MDSFESDGKVERIQGRLAQFAQKGHFICLLLFRMSNWSKKRKINNKKFIRYLVLDLPQSNLAPDALASCSAPQRRDRFRSRYQRAWWSGSHRELLFVCGRLFAAPLVVGPLIRFEVLGLYCLEPSLRNTFATTAENIARACSR